MVNDRQSDVETENITMFVESFHLNNHDESNMSRGSIIVQDVTDNMPLDMSLTSKMNLVKVIQKQTP